MPNELEKILTLISGNLTLFNKQLKEQNAATRELADAVKNQSITVSAPDVRINFADMKVPDLILPEIKLPTINVPEAKVKIDIPKIVVPKPEVTVNLPPQPAPIVNVPAPVVNVEIPKEMEVGGFAAFAKAVLDYLKAIRPFSIFDEVDRQNPIPVILVKSDGSILENFGSNSAPVYMGGGGSGGGSSRMSVMSSGKVASTSPGTPVSFSAVNRPVNQVIVTAHMDNTEVVVVGDSSIVAAAATRQGVQLSQGQAAVFNIDDLQKLYLDVVTSGDKVMYTYLA